MSFWVFPSQVRTQVLEQHVELRALLVQAISHATPSCSAPDADADQLAMTAREMAARFRVHLAFEDEELAQIFAAVDTWGPERVRDLHVEHGRQRYELDTLLAKFESGGEVEQLAAALRVLSAKLLRDMEEEEEGFLQASFMAANSLPVARH